jgi:IS5 family transposase
VQKKAKKLRKCLKNIANTQLRDLRRKMSVNQANQYSEEFQLYQRAVNQHKNDKNKVYSIHKPFTGCISKGKPHKKY